MLSKDVAFPCLCTEAGMDSHLPLSLEKVDSQVPGLLPRALSFGVSTFLHFPSCPHRSLPSLNILHLRLDPASIFYT